MGGCWWEANPWHTALTHPFFRFEFCGRVLFYVSMKFVLLPLDMLNPWVFLIFFLSLKVQRKNEEQEICGE